VWVTARFGVLFMSLNVTKTINMFLAHFRFLKKLQILLMLLGIMHAAPLLPYLHWYPLTSSKSIWQMISIYFYCWWVQDVSFQSTLVVSCIHTHTELWKGLILTPEPGSSPTCIFETRCTGLKVKFTEGVKICAIAE